MYVFIGMCVGICASSSMYRCICVYMLFGIVHVHMEGRSLPPFVIPQEISTLNLETESFTEIH